MKLLRKILPLSILTLTLLHLVDVAHADNSAPPPRVTVDVRKGHGHSDLALFNQDDVLYALARSASQYCFASVDVSDPLLLVDYLNDKNWIVLDVRDLEIKYYFEVDEDGYVIRKCIRETEIEVDSGSDDPFVLTVHQVDEF